MTHTPDDEDFVPLLEISASFTKEELLAKLDAAKKEKARADACVNACAGIPTDKLKPGVVKRLVEAARNVERESSRQTCNYIELRAILRELGSE